MRLSRRRMELFLAAILIVLIFDCAFVDFLDISSSINRYGTCWFNPQRNVYFLKTHKCGSTTVQNILLRHGLKHNLTFALSNHPDLVYFGHGTLFDRNMIREYREGQRYDIMLHHMRFNEREVASVMQPDSVYITIMRDPIEVFKSMYSYYTFDIDTHLDLESFALLPTKFKNRYPRIYGKFGRNQISFDLGVDRVFFDKNFTSDALIGMISKSFDLVMISEYFDESLILLKSLLCLEMQDIVNFSQNKQVSKLNISQLATEKLYEWNSLDVTIYKHFLREFEDRVRAYGINRMKREVEDLRNARRSWFQTCIAKQSNTGLSKNFQVWGPVLGYRLKEDLSPALAKTCESFSRAEVPFTRELLDKYFPENSTEKPDLVRFDFLKKTKQLRRLERETRARVTR